MSTIAKGEITLSPVNDAYTVSLTPSSCVIKADFDGSNPQLSNAKGTITIKRGTKEVEFYLDRIEKSSDNIHINFPQTPRGTSIAFNLTAIDNTSLNGWVDIKLVVADSMGYKTTVRFNYTVVRESTMLDWIQDWEGSKTKVGGTYIMTPKLFVGKKEEVVKTVNGVPTWVPGALTGVYIGPDLLQSGANGAGIYGYFQDKKIFHINADGGFIGGWTFNEAGLQSSNGIVNILAEGTIFAQNPNAVIPYWGIYADGHATFANGNVKFEADGSAEFTGKIKSASGAIGGWHITRHQLYSQGIILDSNKNFIGINASEITAVEHITGDHIFPENPDGGLKLWRTSANDFGMAGWTSSEKVFQLGSTNFIAGWNFNHQAIWSGATTPSLTQGAYSADANSITVAPNGIRSNKWYIDANGTASFVGGSVKFNTGNAEMFGWLMRSGRFSAKHVALVSSEYDCGVYVSPYDLSEVNSSSLKNIISNNGGIYMYSDGANSIMRAYDSSGNLGFRLSTNGYNQIGAWTFDHQSIYNGSTLLDDHGFARKSNSIILSINGLIGPLWKLLPDGSGAVAGDNIRWDAHGNVTFGPSVKLAWTSITGGPNLTKIDANGIYTGTISADKITAGAISTADIICEGKWALMRDGTGYLASHNISWNADGSLTVKGHVEANSGVIGGFKITESGIFSLETNYYTGDVKNGSFSMFSQGSSAFLCFHDDGRWAGIGLNTMPAASNVAVARFENTYSDSTFGWQTNIALVLHAQNGRKNFAYIGTGSGVLSGLIESYGFQEVVCQSGVITALEMLNNNRFLVSCSVDNTGVSLPKVGQVREAFGLGTATEFAVRITICAIASSKSFTVYGRNNTVFNYNDDKSKNYWMNNSNYPVFYNSNRGDMGSINMAQGDCMDVLLIYKNNSYEAYMLSHLS